MSAEWADIKLYRADDGEWLARVFERNYPQILFYFNGLDRNAVEAEAKAFWEKHIEPKRKQREQATASRIEGRRKAAERRLAKAEPTL